MAKYSVLIAGDPWGSETEEKISTYLAEGLKILWFTEKERICDLKEDGRFKGFCDSKAKFMQLYSNAAGYRLVIEDGKTLKGEAFICNEGIKASTVKDILKGLEENDHSFNLEQFEVEHFDPDRHIIVKAGAGSGKTHVMIDRIMFLLHMDEEFDFAHFAMITFTNKATDEMRHRLMKTLDEKYRLTGKVRYLEQIENVASANISTIHSFFRKIIQEVGAILGYGTDFRLKSFSQEREAILHKLLERHYGVVKNTDEEKGNKRKVRDRLGLESHKVEKLAKGFWKTLENEGYTDKKIKKFDWGKCEERGQALQDSLKEILSKVEEEYEKEKIAQNAIAMQDIIHELDKAKGRDKNAMQEYLVSDYRYLFCDEFQDTDNVQIETIVELNRIFRSRLFVVGDIKQSIYRFRGATASAFEYLENKLESDEKKKRVYSSLKKNYRTSEDILDRLDKIFSNWGVADLLQYTATGEDSDRMIAQNTDQGGCEFAKLKAQSWKKDELEPLRKKWFYETIKKVMAREHTGVVCLTRTNRQLDDVRSWCKEMGIPCLIRRRGTFYQSDAVRDFCKMAEGCLYGREPMYLYDRLNSAYIGDKPDESELEKYDGNRETLRDYLWQYPGEETAGTWERYRKELREKPVMAVLREIVAEAEPVKRYVLTHKREIWEEMQNNVDEDALKNQVILDAKQYEADLDKLIRILTDRFSGEFVSLYDICSFLRNMMQTDTEEDQEIVEKMDKDTFFVNGMTVHSAKGLEFDNVLVPFMIDPFENLGRPMILIEPDGKRVGWIYREGVADENAFANENYDDFSKRESLEVRKDETRLLYVALTRAKYGLYCFDLDKKKSLAEAEKWSDLIREDSV